MSYVYAKFFHLLEFLKSIEKTKQAYLTEACWKLILNKSTMYIVQLLARYRIAASPFDASASVRSIQNNDKRLLLSYLIFFLYVFF